MPIQKRQEIGTSLKWFLGRNEMMKTIDTLKYIFIVFFNGTCLINTGDICIYLLVDHSVLNQQN